MVPNAFIYLPGWQAMTDVRLYLFGRSPRVQGTGQSVAVADSQDK